MDFLPENVNQYLEDFSANEDEVLQQLSRETHLKAQMPQMLSGNIQGKFLEMVSRMIAPSRVLEIGTYTGYSAICLAKGLKADGLLYTIDINEELTPMVQKYVALSGKANQVNIMVGNAMSILPGIDEVFDIVFIDADKQNYSNYFDLVIDKVRSGGYIIADNMLWSGKVAQENHDKDTAALHAYNKKLLDDERVDSYILPLRDGLNIARKL